MKTISVPGNILLLGEYAVLEEGGLGITVAVDTRIHLILKDGKELVIKGKYGNREFFWNESGVAGGDVKLLTDVIAQCRKWCTKQDMQCTLTTSTIDIDASAFYSDGRVLGYGFDAAMTVGLTRALLADYPLQAGDILKLAVHAYRKFQGGSGSGHDLAASLYGGTGVFHGGENPSFTPAALDWLPALHLVQNTVPVNTRQSIKQYNKWKAAHPARALDFLIQSNRNVMDLLKAASLETGLAVLSRARNQCIALGCEIGVPALWEEYEEVLNDCCTFYKFLGAGNELALCLFKDGVNPGKVDKAGRGSAAAACEAGAAREAYAGLQAAPLSIAGKGLECSWTV